MQCEVEGCKREAARLDMCWLHYNRLRRSGTTDDPRPLVSCKVCGLKIVSKYELCNAHYKQRWYLNSVGREALLERPSKERWVNIATGYMMVKHNGKLDYEHRALAERALGKPLPTGAIVHHTGARDDNHGFCKLIICPDQEYHKLLHMRMKELGYEVD